MSARARKAVEDALIVAARLKTAGHAREAEIIRRVCRSNTSYRITLGQLWRDNMALRGLEPPLKDAPVGEIGDKIAEAYEDGRDWRVHRDAGSEFAIDIAPDETRLAHCREPRPSERAPFHDGGMKPEPPRTWCEQCDRGVTASAAAACSSRFCKAKQRAAIEDES